MKTQKILTIIGCAFVAQITAHAGDCDFRNTDLSSANFQAAVQRAAEQALQAQIDDAEWYQNHLKRGGRRYSWGAQYERQDYILDPELFR